MKRKMLYTRKYSCLIAMALFALMISCKDDDNGNGIIPPDDDNDDKRGGRAFNVSNGFYIFNVDGDSSVTQGMELKDGKVSVEGQVPGENMTVAREGYSTAYTYLTEGNYIFADIEDKKVSSTLGGTLSKKVGDMWTVNGVGNLTGGYDSIALASEGGAAFNVAAEGVYQVAVDKMTDKAFLMKVENWSLIGPAVGSWTMDIELAKGASTAERTTWEGEDIVIRPGGFKLRGGFNLQMQHDFWSFYQTFG